MQVLQGSWFEPARHLRGQLGGVVSNPPYIPEAQMATLQVSVRCACPPEQRWAVQAALLLVSPAWCWASMLCLDGLQPLDGSRNADC